MFLIAMEKIPFKKILYNLSILKQSAGYSGNQQQNSPCENSLLSFWGLGESTSFKVNTFLLNYYKIETFLSVLTSDFYPITPSVSSTTVQGALTDFHG